MDVNISRPDPKMLELLVCPVTKGRLIYDRETNELISEKARLAYPIRGGIPITWIVDGDFRLRRERRGFGAGQDWVTEMRAAIDEVAKGTKK